MSEDDFDDRSLLQRNRLLVAGLTILFLAGAVFALKHLSSGHSPLPAKPENLNVVKLLPPVLPPPPPPPPPSHKVPEPPHEQKMVEQAPVSEPEQKPDAAPKPEEPPAAPLGTGIAGPGSDAFGLSGHGNGGGYGSGGNGTGGHSGSRWGWFAGQVQNRIAEAIRNNRKTRNASLHVEVRIWPDKTGRITRATISGSTGDPAVDAALKNEVLTGLRLSEPPPEGMPTPIVMRLTARRPN